MRWRRDEEVRSGVKAEKLQVHTWMLRKASGKSLNCNAETWQVRHSQAAQQQVVVSG